MLTMRTAAASVPPVWLAIAMAASVVGGCSQLGGGTTYLEVYNRTAVPILMEGSSWVSRGAFVPACESATFIWGRAEDGAGSTEEPPADAVTIEIPTSLSPPADPSSDGTQSLIVSSEAVFGYTHGATLPSMPPCEGRPPAD